MGRLRHFLRLRSIIGTFFLLASCVGSEPLFAQLDKPIEKDPGDSGPEPPPPLEKVLIQARKPYDRLIIEIGKLGGRVTHEYKHFDAVAAEIPRSSLEMVGSLPGLEEFWKDLPVTPPKPAPLLDEAAPEGGGLRQVAAGPFLSASALSRAAIPSFATAYPDAYRVNNAFSNAAALHAAGFDGAGVIVAVLDSGIRPGFFHLESDGSVIGGEDLVGDGLGFSNPSNNGHGTMVAGMISANAVFSVPTTSTFFQSVQAHIPDAIVPPDGIAMIGSAPSAKIYALRIFPPSGVAPTSRILAGVDRVMELRRKFEAGEPGGVNIQVANMSFGKHTLFAGRDLLDTAVNALLDNDIVFVHSVGNAGPAGLTIGSAASSYGTITVGAASLAHNERIAEDLRRGLGNGVLARPFDGIQIPFFSSRGPHADGRGDPEVVANGDWVFGQGFFNPGDFAITSGTSFSAPTVAGIAAALRQAFPDATARQIRNAIVAGANPGPLPNFFGSQDRGSGYVDALASFNLLAAGGVSDAPPEPPPSNKIVKNNLENSQGFLVEGGTLGKTVGPLAPGERREIYYAVTSDAVQVVVQVSNVIPSLPPADQNQLFFGDRLVLGIHTAKTSAIGAGDYRFLNFTTGTTQIVNRPEPGILRVTLLGAWTNVGDISADLTLSSVEDRFPAFTEQGRITEFEEILLPILMPPGVATAEFRLDWHEGWENYPVNDLDLVLDPPKGSSLLTGATLSAPERVEVKKPTPGTWTARVQGFELHSREDLYRFRARLDGATVKQNQGPPVKPTHLASVPKGILIGVEEDNNGSVEMGPVGFSSFSDLALAPDGRLFGSLGFGSASGLGGKILRIDPETGVGTEIGPSGFDAVPALDFHPGGTLYGIGSRLAAAGQDQYLITIDTGTGAATTVAGPLSVPFLDGIVFASNGNLYGAGWIPSRPTNNRAVLVVINPMTGFVIQIGPIGFEFVAGLEEATDGFLLGTLGGIDPLSGTLVRIDPATGLGVAVAHPGFSPVSGLTRLP